MATPSTTVARPRIRFTARAALLATAVIVLAIMAISPVKLYIEQRREIGQLQEQTVRLTQENASLEQRMAQLKDPTYLAQLARECLGMVRQGETAFVVIPRGQQQPKLEPC